MEFSVGDRVYVGYPLHRDEARGFVYAATVVAVEGDRAVVRSDQNGLFTVGGKWDTGGVFRTESKAWRHCAAALRVRAAEIAAAAEKCDAHVVDTLTAEG